MKIAGRKNDGAWYRTNRWIRSLSLLENNPIRVSLVAAIKSLPTLQPFVDDLVDLSNQTDTAGNDGTITADAIATTYGTSGIPRCVWDGKFSFDTYSKGTVGDKEVYKPDHPDAIRLFSIDIRELTKRLMFGSRQVVDALNTRSKAQGNPGGVADANKNT